MILITCAVVMAVLCLLVAGLVLYDMFVESVVRYINSLSED